MSERSLDKDYFTTTEAAKLLSVAPDTVLKWVKAGKVKSYRTLGGHFRIPANELESMASAARAPVRTGEADELQPVLHQYCWEYLAAGGDIKSECRDCITFKSRARRCYELKDLPGGLGCFNLMCDTDCNDCEYFKLVSGQGLNILIVGDGDKTINGLDRLDKGEGLRVRVVLNEYDASTMIQRFRPDYIVVDCAFGKRRTAGICNNLFGDSRIPVARIILASRTRKIHDYCDKEVFGWIRKPFEIEQLKRLIRGVPKIAEKHW